nr:hypothetical protein [Tanacetum cinerariifolium]
MVEAGNAAYTDKFHELARLVPHLVTPKSMKIKRNRSIKKVEKRGNEKRIRVLGLSVPLATPIMHPEGLVAHASTVTAQGRENQGNQARGRVFMLGADEARQDLNIMMGIEPSELGFKYEIEIASKQLVEIHKVIKGCTLEIEGHVFNIDLIPLDDLSRLPPLWEIEF